jgi:hypothetical protein
MTPRPSDPIACQATPPSVLGEKLVYWRRELPPLGEAILSEQIVEADSRRLAIGSHHEELWEKGAAELLEEATRRIEQEIHRQGGSCAHIVDEQVEPKVDYSIGKMWLHGRYTYVLYRHEQPR